MLYLPYYELYKQRIEAIFDHVLSLNVPVEPTPQSLTSRT